MKIVLKLLFRRLFTDYSLYWIYSCPTSQLCALDGASQVCVARLTDCRHLAETELETLSNYAGEGSVGFRARLGSKLVLVCFY